MAYTQIEWNWAKHSPSRGINALLSDEEYRRFQSQLVANPAEGVLIKGGAGLRKIRVPLRNRGKSGGARVIYYWVVRKDLILLLYAYPKNVTANLSAKQTAQLAKLIREEFDNEIRNV